MIRSKIPARCARAGRSGRPGVTLVEMLVATAMCILGMWMLTWMFQQATASFSLANAQATLTGQERMVATIMTRDLEANKFPEDDRYLPATGGRYQKLSDYGSPGAGYSRPRGGYFLAQAGVPDNTNNFLEATDTYGFTSTRAGNHFLQFTVIVPDTPGNRLVAEVPAGGGKTVAGTAIEVSYFLVPIGTTSTGARLHDLMRVQRLVALSQYDARDYLTNFVQPAYNLTPPDAVHEVMVSAAVDSGISPQTTPPTAKMYTLTDLATNFNGCRFGRSVRATTSKRFGEDRLLANVLSLEAKFTGPTVAFSPWTAPAGAPGNVTAVPAWTDASPLQWPRPLASNSDFPYDFLPFDGQFDTAASGGPQVAVGGGTPPQTKPTREPIRITGVQIRVRALFGTTARQTTITVAL